MVSEIAKSAWVTWRAQPPFWIRFGALLNEAQNRVLRAGIGQAGRIGDVDRALRRPVGIAELRAARRRHPARGGGSQHIAPRDHVR
jgi:hypothetical protein